MKSICLVGFINSGKDTSAEILKNIFAGATIEKFAEPVGDAAAAVFKMERKMLAGLTIEDRKKREEIDPFWGIAPRNALIKIGMLFRNEFDPNIWVKSLLRRTKDKKIIIISDMRFRNEMEIMKQETECIIIRIKRGDDPIWFHELEKINDYNLRKEFMKLHAPMLSESEFDWVGSPSIDFTIENNGTIEDLNKMLTTLFSRS